MIRDPSRSCKKAPTRLLEACAQRLQAQAPAKTSQTQKIFRKPVFKPNQAKTQTHTAKKTATELFNQIMIRDPTTKNLFLEYNSKKVHRRSDKGNIFHSAQNLHSGLVKPSHVKPKPTLRAFRHNNLKSDLEGRRPIQILQDLEGLNTKTDFNLTNFSRDRRDVEDFKCQTLRKLFVEKFIE